MRKSQGACACHDILLEKITNSENKCGKGNEAEHKIPVQDMFSCTDQTCSFDSSDEGSSLMQTIPEVASMVSNQTLPGMVEAPPDKTAPSRTASIMMLPSAILPSVYELFKKSSSIPNNAKKSCVCSF